MDLTDEQWALIRPLLPPPSSHSKGRPPTDPRPTLNGVLWKLRLGAAWYDLPPHTAASYPSWQTYYRRYRLWCSSGLMDEIYRLLYQDLCDRAGIDLFQALHEETITLNHCDFRWHLRLPPELEGTWQGSTIMLLVHVILLRLKSPARHQLPRTLIIKYHPPG